jgi:serine/threonine-protein kinase
MSDPTLADEPADRNLLFGALAVKLELLTQADLDSALDDWRADRSRSLGQYLVERHLLLPRQRNLLEDVLREYLACHDMDLAKGLKAACLPRTSPIRVTRMPDAPTLPTPPSGPGTLPDMNLPMIVLPDEFAKFAHQRFRVLHPHARGALGEVFVAHDQELNREVALKEIQAPYAHHPDSRARFVLEAEITGGLEHPGIVPVYSLSFHPDGRPFYAMRFIKGESLHQAIDRFHEADTPQRDATERTLEMRQLLTRFVTVCHAIDYAHSRGVIHRDLKPSNIMLGPYGESLVVDWGLAKAFDQPMTTDSIELPIHPTAAGSTQATMLGQAVGTPAFMPPEQAAGRVDQMGPRSDIYSLGATLYNLVTGELPFSGNASDVLRQVKTSSPSPPRKRNRHVPAPLDAIVMKAMAFKPDDRYQSVHELAQEVERYLADEKVLAHKESIVERSLRWMRHHRPYVYAASALVLTTLVGLGVILWAVNREQKRTAEERDNANYNLKLAKKAVDECFQLAKETPLLQEERMQDVRKLLLEKALPFYQGFLNQRPDDKSILFEIGRNRFRVGYIIDVIGKKSDAIESYEAARVVFASLLQDDAQNENYLSDLGSITNNLGVLRRDTGEPAKALVALQEARKYREDLVKKQPQALEHQSDLAHTCNNLGVLHRDRKQRRDALDCFEQARDIFRSLTIERKEHADLAGLATTYHNIGRLQAELEDADEALKAYDQAQSILEGLVKQAPEVTRYRAAQANTLLNLGALVHTHDPARAKMCYDRAQQLCEGLVKERPGVAEFQADLARATNALATHLCHNGQPKEAIPLHLRAVGILEALLKKHEDETDYRLALAGTCINTGHAHRDAKQGEAALEWYKKALLQIREVEKRTKDLPESRDLLCKAHLGRAETLAGLGKHREALEDFRVAIQLAQPGEHEHRMIQTKQAFALAHAGEHRLASKEVSELERMPGGNDELLYELACISSLAAKAASQDTTLPEAKRKQLSEDNAMKAVEFLERARLLKFFHKPENVEHLKNDLKEDGDLQFLKGRKDYQSFREQLEQQHKKPGG